MSARASTVTVRNKKRKIKLHIVKTLDDNIPVKVLYPDVINKKSIRHYCRVRYGANWWERPDKKVIYKKCQDTLIKNKL